MRSFVLLTAFVTLVAAPALADEKADNKSKPSSYQNGNNTKSDGKSTNKYDGMSREITVNDKSGHVKVKPGDNKPKPGMRQ